MFHLRISPLILAVLADLQFLCPVAFASPQTMLLKAIYVDLSQPPASQAPRSAISIPRHFANPALIRRVKSALAAGASTNPALSSTQIATAPAVPISSGVTVAVPIKAAFDGMTLWDGGGYIPPDTTVAAGPSLPSPTLLLEAVNSLGAVYDTTGALKVNLNTTACTTNTSTDSVSDPRVEFDPLSGRWFISTVTFSPISDASWNLLFSLSGDPTASTWGCLIVPTSRIHNPDGTTGNFPDFPKMGVNYTKVVLTGDAYSAVRHGLFSVSYKFQGTEFVVINKSKLLSGTASVAVFAPNQGDYAIEPAQELTSTSTNDTMYMAAVNSTLASTSALDVWQISGVPGNTSHPLKTHKTSPSLPIHTISLPPNAQQADTSVLIATNDDSLLDAAFRDASGSSPGALWVSANDACTPPGDGAVRSCPRFINVSTVSNVTTMKVVQDFDYADAGKYYYYPAIRTDINGDLFAVFSGSSGGSLASGGSYASVYAGEQLAGTTNALTNLSMTRAGDSPYSVTASPTRWGDYSGAGVDPSGTSGWLAGEYATSNFIFGSYWGTAIVDAMP
jgi:hypothetical protein